MLDFYRRKIEYVRISVTDRCNLRCRYCMPADGVEKLSHEDILSFEEIVRVVRALAQLGIRKVRLTGGEPLLRRGIVDLVREIKAVEGIERVALTTNGVLLADLAEELRAAGLDGVNISLDTLAEDAFSDITRRSASLLPAVRQGMEAALAAGLKTKLNCVPLKGVNEAELVSLAALAKERPIDVRFIELMPIGMAKEAGLTGVPTAEVRRILEESFGALVPVVKEALTGPATCFRPAGFRGALGFIDALEHKFCSSCNRVRLTAEGYLKLCLALDAGLDLRTLLRTGADDAALFRKLRQVIAEKPREHHFEAAGGAGEEKRRMYQIGG